MEVAGHPRASKIYSRHSGPATIVVSETRLLRAGAPVNVNLTHALLAAANEQPHGFLKVRSPRLVREVELMAEAGLVEFSRGDSEGETFAVINRLTGSGRAFLRTWKDKAPRKIAPLASS